MGNWSKLSHMETVFTGWWCDFSGELMSTQKSLMVLYFWCKWDSYSQNYRIIVFIAFCLLRPILGKCHSTFIWGVAFFFPYGGEMSKKLPPHSTSFPPIEIWRGTPSPLKFQKAKILRGRKFFTQNLPPNNGGEAFSTILLGGSTCWFPL